MRGRIFVGVTAWLAGAAAATAFSHLAVSNLAKGIGGDPGQLLSNSAVRHALASAPRTSAGGTWSPSPPGRPTAAGNQSSGIVLASPGGTVVASCTGNVAYLKSWSPLQGFVVDAVIRGPALATQVAFESPVRTVTMRIACVAGSTKVDLLDQPAGSSFHDE